MVETTFLKYDPDLYPIRSMAAIERVAAGHQADPHLQACQTNQLLQLHIASSYLPPHPDLLQANPKCVWWRV
jgi:hypothetical protein